MAFSPSGEVGYTVGFGRGQGAAYRTGGPTVPEASAAPERASASPGRGTRGAAVHGRDPLSHACRPRAYGRAGLARNMTIQPWPSRRCDEGLDRRAGISAAHSGNTRSASFSLEKENRSGARIWPNTSRLFYRRHRRRPGRGHGPVRPGRRRLRNRPEHRAHRGTAQGPRGLRHPRPQGPARPGSRGRRPADVLDTRKVREWAKKQASTSGNAAECPPR